MVSNADRYVLAGRLKGYLKNYQDAVDIFSEGIEHHPHDATLYRHRGHRYITLRQFDKAIEDFSRAAELSKDKPDEMDYYQPTAEQDIINLLLGHEGKVHDQHQAVTDDVIEATKDLYKSTLKSSIYYHWALAHYLKGDFETAVDIYKEALNHAIDGDMIVATNDWLYMTLRRLGRHEEAQKVLDNIDSQQLKVMEPSYMRRIKMYKGELRPEDLINPNIEDKRSLATQGYGVGNWYLYSGDSAKAHEVFERVVAAGSSDAFGYIASEIELKRVQSS